MEIGAENEFSKPLQGAIWLCSLLLAGCSTHAQLLQQPRQLFYDNQLASAHAKFAQLTEKKRGDATVLELDLAMVDLLRGEPKLCEQRLRSVRDTWDHLEQTSAVESATALLTDDRRRAYHGEDYEKLLVRVFLALSSLMNDGVDAESYTLQVLAKHEQLLGQATAQWGETVSQSFQAPPIGMYLRGVLREASLRNYDDALRAYQATAQLLPEAPFLQQDIERVTYGVHSRPGCGVLYVFTMVGRGPYKVEVAAQATSDALLIADRIVSMVGQYSVPPTLAPIKVPRIVSPTKPFDVLEVSVAGQAVGYTLPVTDLHQLASQTFDAKLPHIMARAISRRVIKKGAIYLAKDQLNAAAPLASIAMDAAGVAWEATEAADTRCWGLLPREIQVLRVELPAGRHQLSMQPVTAGRAIAQACQQEVDIVDGRNTYTLSYWPDSQPIGQTLVNAPLH